MNKVQTIKETQVVKKGPECSCRRKSLGLASQQPEGGHPCGRMYKSKDPTWCRRTHGEQKQDWHNQRQDRPRLAKVKTHYLGRKAPGKTKVHDKPRKQETHPKAIGRINPTCATTRERIGNPLKQWAHKHMRPCAEMPKWSGSSSGETKNKSFQVKGIAHSKTRTTSRE